MTLKRIAIIGSGISGLGAAYALKDTAHITLFERDPTAGGHACTHTVDYDGVTIPVDLGFIVYNGLNYPNLIGLFDSLGVQTQPSDMSFSVSDPDGWQWASTARGLFAQPGNMLRPGFLRFLKTILRFNDTARTELATGGLTDTTLGAWLDRHSFDATFRDNYILPMAAAIWSTPEDRILDYPAQSFFQFFDNHRLMHRERPKWRTVTGGSQNYVRRLTALLGDRFRPGTAVQSVGRFGARVRVTLESGNSELFDEVILATHSDVSLRLLGNDDSDACFLLRSVRYRPNTIYLHRDPALMPPRRAAWASWNVLKQGSGEICLTYWMNRLQGIDAARPLFITLNPNRPPRAELIFHTYQFDHPQFDAPAEAAVRALKRIQGQDGIWFAGAWMGRGFHEDGLKSGLAAALALGGRVPWHAKGVDNYAPIRDTRGLGNASEASV